MELKSYKIGGAPNIDQYCCQKCTETTLIPEQTILGLICNINGACANFELFFLNDSLRILTWKLDPKIFKLNLIKKIIYASKCLSYFVFCW